MTSLPAFLAAALEAAVRAATCAFCGKRKRGERARNPDALCSACEREAQR